MVLYSNKYIILGVIDLEVCISVQISVDEILALVTQKGSDPPKGWFTSDELKEIMENENRISIAKGS